MPKEGLSTMQMELDPWDARRLPSNDMTGREMNAMHSHHEPVTPRASDVNTSQPHRPDHAAVDKPGFLRRELKRLDIFMVAVCLIIGMGFYIKSGTILRIGGSGAVIYSFLFLGFLALMIMRNLTTMLRIWPVASALVVFVESFVDQEVGKSVAILYWLTYCFSFAGLTTTIGSLLEYNSYGISRGWIVFISVVSLILPILCNLAPIQIFRRIEVFFGSLKLVLALSIIIIMNVINPTVVEKSPATVAGQKLDSANGTNVFHFEEGATGGWFSALMASIFLASFAFVGIEVVGATAHEAKFKSTTESTSSMPEQGEGAADEEASLSDSASRLNEPDNIVRDPFEYVMLVPIVVTAIYVWGGWIVSQNVYWKDLRLPNLNEDDELSTLQMNKSPFIISAEDYSGPSASLPKALTAFLIINVASTSSTALYVAARTLFGFFYTINQGYSSQYHTWWLTVARTLSQKNRFDVPYVAVLVSAWLFWVPFLRYANQSNFSSVVDIITQMASVSCIIVWAIVSFATLRFYLCFQKHYRAGALTGYRRIELMLKSNSTEFLFRVIGCGISVILCLLVIIIGGSMAYVLSKDPSQAVAAFLMIAIFIVLTICFKMIKYYIKGDTWSWLVDLDDEMAVKTIFQNMDDQTKHNTEGD